MWTTFKSKLAGAWKSWTIWVNTIAGAAIILLPMAVESLPQLHDYIPDQPYKIAMGLLIAANILLRFKTNIDLAAKGK